MTLKEKFEQVESPVAIELEKIADDYAIEFAEWMMSKFISIEPEVSFKGLHNGDFSTTNELLKIFKKQKGL